MAFDEELAERVRAVLAEAGVRPTEKKMFGGLSFLIGGNMGRGPSMRLILIAGLPSARCTSIWRCPFPGRPAPSSFLSRRRNHGPWHLPRDTIFPC